MYLPNNDNAQQAMLSKYHRVMAKAIQVVYIKGRQQQKMLQQGNTYKTRCAWLQKKM